MKPEAGEKRCGSAGLIKCNLRLFVEISVLELPRVQNTFPKAAQGLDFRLLYPTDGCNGQVTSSSKQWLRNFFFLFRKWRYTEFLNIHFSVK
jgi:hypothetical protein